MQYFSTESCSPEKPNLHEPCLPSQVLRLSFSFPGVVHSKVSLAQRNLLSCSSKKINFPCVCSRITEVVCRLASRVKPEHLPRGGFARWRQFANWRVPESHVVCWVPWRSSLGPKNGNKCQLSSMDRTHGC